MMVLWQWVGRALALTLVAALCIALLGGPVLIWGWNGWTGVYVGFWLSAGWHSMTHHPILVASGKDVAGGADVR